MTQDYKLHIQSENIVAKPPAAERLSRRPAVSLNMHRKSGNGIEEGSETKHALDQAQTKAVRCQTQ